MDWFTYLLLAVAAIIILRRVMGGGKGVENLTPDQVQERSKSLKKGHLVDVREPHEFSSGHIRGAKNIPLGQMSTRLDELDKDAEVILVCRSGNRSGQAARILKRSGFQKVAHLQRGMMSWNGSVQKGKS